MTATTLPILAMEGTPEVEVEVVKAEVAAKEERSLRHLRQGQARPKTIQGIFVRLRAPARPTAPISASNPANTIPGSH